MNVIRRIDPAAPAGVKIAEDQASLSKFLDPESAATIWQRQMPQNVQDWLDNLDPELLPRGRTSIAASAVTQTVQQMCDASGLPRCPERSWLESDIAWLAAAFSDLLKPPFLRVRLDVVTSNACRKFHIDAITARLLCTYRGTGTQYGISHDRNDPKRVFTVQKGAPVLLRGSLWPSQPPAGVLHRSPPIEGTGETRLVLVLDPLSQLEDSL